MVNHFLSERTAQDINKRIERIMRGLGNPAPPLDLLQVRELLNLDRSYYSASDAGVLQETISRMKVAGKQVLMRPWLLVEAIKKLELKALYIPDQKRILIDKDLPQLKLRWNESHEIAHDIIPWHSEMMLGDTEHTLSRTCHEKIEREANYGAGRLLFLGDMFFEESNSTNPTFASILELNKRYGNTITSTLWRYVESAHIDRAMFSVVTGHPKYPKPDFSPFSPCRYFVRSPRFAQEFRTANDKEIFSQIQSYCSYRKRHLIGAGEVVIKDDNGDNCLFECETFYNGYDALTLGVYTRKLALEFAF